MEKINISLNLQNETNKQTSKNSNQQGATVMGGAPRSPPHFLIPSYDPPPPQDFWPLPVSFDIIFKTLCCAYLL